MPLSKTPRAWQTLALEKWTACGSRGICEVVTGGGKTVFAEMCIDRYLRDVPDGQVAVVVPTLSLLDQWFVGLQDDLGLSSDLISTYSGEGCPKQPSTVNVLVLNTARRWAPEISLARPTFLVVDECHRAGSAVNSKVLDGQYSAALGLSATPYRQDGGLEARLVPALGPVFYEYGYNEAARDGVIASFDLVNVEIALSESEKLNHERISRRIAAELGRRSGADEGRVRRLALDRAAVVAQARMRIPVAVKVVDAHRGERAIVFHERVEAAEEIYRLLRDRGHMATIYHSGLDTGVRRDNLRQYRRGVFDVLVTCRALDEGMDVPETAVAVIASSTASDRQRIQRLGRALRQSRRKPKAVIITLFATEQERSRLEAEEQHLVEAESVIWQRAQMAE